jgi:hypothetical protein
LTVSASERPQPARTRGKETDARRARSFNMMGI